MTDSLQPVGHGARSWLGGHSHQHGVAGEVPADAFEQRGRLAQRVEDAPPRIPKGFLENSEDDLLREMRDAARVIRYSARNVDQYQVGTLGDVAESETFVELFSDFSAIGEIIEAVLVSGPPNTPFVLNLGKHTFDTLITNAQGFCLLAPIRMKLDPTDKRILTAIGAPSIPAPQPATPTFPLSTVQVQNTNLFPVNVTFTGGTFSAVFVNGIQVGTTSLGPYLVPSGQPISITYTAAPTWAWTNANPATPAIPAAGAWGFELMGRPDDPGRRY